MKHGGRVLRWHGMALQTTGDSSLVERVKSWSNNDVGQLRAENEKQEDYFLAIVSFYESEAACITARSVFVSIYPVDQINAIAKCIDRQ